MTTSTYFKNISDSSVEKNSKYQSHINEFKNLASNGMYNSHNILDSDIDNCYLERLNQDGFLISMSLDNTYIVSWKNATSGNALIVKNMIPPKPLSSEISIILKMIRAESLNGKYTLNVDYISEDDKTTLLNNNFRLNGNLIEWS